MNALRLLTLAFVWLAFGLACSTFAAPTDVPTPMPATATQPALPEEDHDAPAVEIAYGQSPDAELGNPAGHYWTFSGHAGDVVLIVLRSHEFDTVVELYGPEGAFLAENDDDGSESNSRLDYLLPTTGDYGLVVRSYGGGTGAYRLSLVLNGNILDRDTPGGPIEYGQDVSDYVLGAEGDRWTFSGEMGDWIAVDMSSDTLDTYLELVGPDGLLLMENDDSTSLFDSRLEWVLQEGGSYTVIARSYDNGTGAYRLALERTAAGVEIGGPPRPVEFDSPVEAILANPDGDRWTFTGEAGDVVLAAMDSDAFDTLLTLLGPDDSTLATDDDGGPDSNAAMSHVLPETGEYTIVASSFSGNGAYTLTVSRLGNTAEADTPGGPIAYGDSVVDVLVDVEGDRWTFSGAEGDRVVIVMEGIGLDATLALLDPRGERVAENDDFDGLNPRIEFTLARSGEHVIVATSIGGDLGMYRLRLDR